MEDFLVMVFILLATAIALAPVLAVLALRRARRAEERVDDLHRAVRRLREQLSELGPARPGSELATGSEEVTERVPPRPSRPGRSVTYDMWGAPIPSPAADETEEPPVDDGGRTEEEAAPIEELSPIPPAAESPEDAEERFRPARVRPARVRPARKQIDWERWLGVRGAAIVGGIALALAGLFFAQYAITHGYFGPAARVTAGGLVGAALLLLRSRVQRLTSPLVADALAGAGAVMGYASAWSAWKLHGLIPLEAAFPWMAAITLVSCLVSGRQRSQVVAAFAVVGGFATPLLLETWTGSELGLFGYVLVLDLCLLALARARRWSWLAPTTLVGTALVKGLWLLSEAGPEQGHLSLLVTGGFSLVFLLASRSEGPEERGAALTRYVGVGLSGLVALLLADGNFTRATVGLEGLALFLLLLSAATAVIARREDAPGARLAAATAASMILGTWLLNSDLEATFQGDLGTPFLARLAGAFFALALLWFLDALRGGGRLEGPWLLRREAPLAVTGLSGLGALWFLTGDFGSSVHIAPLAAGGTGLVALTWLATERTRGWLPATSATLLAFCLVTVRPNEGTYVDHALVVALALLGHLDGRRGRLVALLAPLPVLVVTAAGPMLTGLTLLAALGAARSRVEAALPVVVLAAAVGSQRYLAGLDSAGALELILVLAPAFAAFAPFLRRAGGWVPLTAGLAVLLWLMPGPLALGERLLGVPGYLLVLACLPAVIAWRARGDAHAEASVAVLTGFAISFAIDREPIVVGVVLAGLGLLVVARLRAVSWADTAGALAQGIGATGLLVLCLVPGRFPSSAIPGTGTVLLVLGLPMALLVGGSLLTRPARHRAGLGVGAALLGFAWLCLGVADAFHDGAHIRFVLERHEARDLALSTAWALYALALLGLGTWLRRQALRYVSLAFTLLTVGKVFLFDLGELEGLYRVASMAGLAVSLMLVSLLYQRVVFRRSPDEA